MNPLSLLKSKFAGYKGVSMPSLPVQNNQSIKPPAPAPMSMPKAPPVNFAINGINLSTGTMKPTVPQVENASTQGSYGTIQNINGGQVYSDPRDNPNFMGGNQSMPKVPDISGNSAQGGTSTPEVPTMPTISPEAQNALKLAEDAYKRSLSISPEELSTQADLDRLAESTKMAYTGIKDKAIPMQFITGQLASAEERALNLAEPLERRLARMQAARTASVEASKFALERADKAITAEREAVKPISGSSFYDPKTGKFIQAPATPKIGEGFTLSPGERRYDAQGNLIASGGPKELSATAEAKLLESQEKANAAQQSAGQTIGIVNTLLSDTNSIKALFGIPGISAFVPGTATQAAKNQYNQLKAQLALGARSLLKGSGAVSDYEAKVLQNSTSSLGRNISDSQAVQELKRIRGVLKTNQGLATEVTVTNPETGEKITAELTGDEIYNLSVEGNVITYN